MKDKKIEKNAEEEFVKIQYELQQQIDFHNMVNIVTIKNVAGVDLAYWNINDEEYAVCCIVVLNYKTKEKVTKKNLFLRLETTYRFVNVENPEEYIDITTYGDGIDSQDKAVGKAMTYGDKYALMKCYKIVTGDDPDQNPSEDLKGLEKKPVDENNYRKELIMFCKENGLDIVKISKEFKLTSTSSQEEFKKTLESIRGK